MSKRPRSTSPVRPYRRCSRDSWYARVADTPLLLELWSMIAEATDDLSTRLALSRVSVGLFHALGDFRAFAALAIKIEDQTTYGRYAATLVSAQTLFHPLRWALLTDNWTEGNTFEQCVLTNILPTLALASHFRTMAEACQWDFAHHVYVAGGYPRAVLLRALRMCGVQGICPRLTEDVGDVDVWLSLGTHREGLSTKHVLNEMEHVGEFMAHYWLNQKPLEKEALTPKAQWPSRGAWSIVSLPLGVDGAELQVQCLIESSFTTGVLFNPAKSYPTKDVLDGRCEASGVALFDLPCTQVAFMGNWFSPDGGGDLVLTPFAAASYFSGIMRSKDRDESDIFEDSFRDHWLPGADWNGVDRAPFLEFHCLLDRGEGIGLTKPPANLFYSLVAARRAFRVLKYIQRGYTWIVSKRYEKFYTNFMRILPGMFDTPIFSIPSRPSNANGNREEIDPDAYPCEELANMSWRFMNQRRLRRGSYLRGLDRDHLIDGSYESPSDHLNDSSDESSSDE